MSIYPVSQALIPPDWTRDPPITPCLLIFHTAVSNALAPGPSAGGVSGLEWHFYIAEGGEIVQRRDTGEEADANFHANSFTIGPVRYGAISVETWDGGDPEGNPWNDAQVASMVRLCHLAYEIDAVPLQRPAAWNGEGVGYHRQYAEWNNPYHSCPGDTRAAQFDNTIWPMVLQGDTPDMTPDQEAKLNEINAFVVQFKQGSGFVFDPVRKVIADELKKAGVGSGGAPAGDVPLTGTIHFGG